MPSVFHPLLLILANPTHRELAAQVQYLKAENEILRSKLSKRIAATPAERARLVKLGKKVGGAIKEGGRERSMRRVREPPRPAWLISDQSTCRVRSRDSWYAINRYRISSAKSTASSAQTRQKNALSTIRL